MRSQQRTHTACNHPMDPSFGKLLMALGFVVFTVGVVVSFNLLPWLGRLPGDIAIKRENFSFYFPITTCIVVSVLLTLILKFFRKH